ncbi:hypothetical protein B0H17DRAFT_397173 [Mycena rosella]|uniref:Uncharacterized protein n=1 Tax=Mycena rosella TaxID=1033263 RepID=A0AAD7G438_MYCRO|nr:hypothetical protein B0H17DRAFT_397173 [Mycena rosella]
MHFLFPSIAALAGLSAVAAAPNVKRSITAPSTGTSISSGESIPFNYVDSNWCHEGYTPITLWLSDAAPTGLNATGDLPDGTYIAYFGRYLIANFGIPAMQPVPPTSVTIPDISCYPAGSTLYFSVVEEAQEGTCPGGILTIVVCTVADLKPINCCWGFCFKVLNVQPLSSRNIRFNQYRIYTMPMRAGSTSL